MPKKRNSTNDPKTARRYKSYSNENLLKAIREIGNKKISINAASKRYGIAKGTLMNKLKKKHTQKVGRPLVLTTTEELCIVHHMITVSDWGFPFSRADLCQLVKIYLDKSKRSAPQIKENYPSLEWAERFLERHKKQLTERVCQNIKLSRAALTVEGLNVYFDNLQGTLTLPDGSIIPPERIFNYDETNLSDDPGVKKCIFRRGVKYPERVRDSSKACTSLMFCGSAAGQMLPPYVVYKALNIYDTWMEGGPANTRYNRSKSGWFDSTIFTDWVINMFIPFIKTKRLNKNGNKVVLIGDNLSSHFTNEVLSACKENNILFVCIPPNSTHITQPLDVAFYRPLKHYWRAILDRWKKKSKKKSQTITKEAFPGLLNELYKQVVQEDGETSTNLISGFRKCGIYPIDRTQVISRIPQKRPMVEEDAEEVVQNVSDAVLDMLRELRPATSNQTRKKRTKVNVEPGKSIRREDLESKDDQSDISGSESHDLPLNHAVESDSDKVSIVDKDNISSDDSDDLSDNDSGPDQNSHEDNRQQLITSVNVSDYVVIKLSLDEDKYSVAKVLEKNDVLSVKVFSKTRNKFIEAGCDIRVLPNQIMKILSTPVETRRGLSFDDEYLKFVTFH